MKVHVKKRPFLLLEVLLAFCLISFCAIPLIYPHIVMIKAQKEFINKIKINHAVNLLFVDILEKMHKNEISLADIESQKVFPIEGEELKKIPGFTSTYQFIKEKHKARDKDGITVHLATVQLSLISKTGKIKHFDYDVLFGSKRDPEIEDKDAEDDED